MAIFTEPDAAEPDILDGRIVIHTLKDGTHRNSMKGCIVSEEDVPEAFRVMERETKRINGWL